MSIVDRQHAVIEELAAGLGVETAALRAIIRVEAGKEGLNPDGTPIIRVEAHKLLARNSAFANRFRVTGKKPWLGHQWLNEGTWIEMHTTQANEHVAYAAAKAIDSRAAILSTSFGAGQVMGSNYSAVGYSSPEEFEEDMRWEGAQLKAMASYIAHAKLEWAIREKAWHSFATAYNGPGQAAKYAALIESAYLREL